MRDSNEVAFHTVGQLKALLADLPDDRLIVCQVIAQDGSAWNLRGDFCPQVEHGTIAVLALSHPDLQTLPAWPDAASQLANVKRWHKHAYGDDLPEAALYYNK